MPSLSRNGIGGLNVEINELFGSSLDAHSALIQDADLISGRDVLYNPVATVENTEDVEFNIPPDPECFFILDQTRLEGNFSVQTDDNQVVESTDEVTLTNHYCAALFSQIEIYLNGTQVCDLSAPVSFPFKQYIDTALTYHLNMLNNVGKAEGCHLDMDGPCRVNFNDNSIDEERTCGGLYNNHINIRNGKRVYFSMTLPADVLNIDKYLPSNIEIDIKLKRFNPKFGIMQSADEKTFSIMLKDLKLRMRKVLPSIRIRNRLNSCLSSGKDCFLPFKDTQLKHFHIPVGSRCYNATHINTNGVLPKQIIFCFTQSEVLTKDKTNKFPFYFHHCNVDSILLKNNGKPLMPRPIQCDFDSGDIMELYNHFQTSIGTKNWITFDHFASGSTFLVFDLTPDKCHSFHNHVSVAGNLELDLTFSAPTQSNFTMISYAVFNAGLIINRNLQVIKRIY